MSVVAIVGSAFATGVPESLTLEAEIVATEFGDATLHRCRGIEREAYVLFRHGLPHHLLPHHIDYRANAAALNAIRCNALLVTSSVGVLNPDVPLGVPLPVQDLIHLDNRLPDGTACTMFPTPRADHGHLVLGDGLFSTTLTAQLHSLALAAGHPLGPAVTFAYVQGPRTKTAAENRVWKQLGADVNSMTLAPEVILANELEIPCVGLVVGHKPSRADVDTEDTAAIARSLEAARDASVDVVIAFLREAQPVPFANSLFRF